MNTTRSKLFILFLALAASLVSADIFAAKPVKITVTEAVPNEALQGDALPVRIKGTGFDPGSTVKLRILGSPISLMGGPGFPSFTRHIEFHTTTEGRPFAGQEFPDFCGLRMMPKR